MQNNNQPAATGRDPGNCRAEVQTRDSLKVRRRSAAEVAFQGYNLEGPVERVGGWEYDVPGMYMTRAVFMVPRTSGDTSEEIEFAVWFRDANSAEVVEAFAVDIDDVLVGHDPAKSGTLLEIDQSPGS